MDVLANGTRHRPLVFKVTWRWTRRRRVLVAVVAVVLFWIAEITFFIIVYGPPVFGSRPLPDASAITKVL